MDGLLLTVMMVLVIKPRVKTERSTAFASHSTDENRLFPRAKFYRSSLNPSNAPNIAKTLPMLINRYHETNQNRVQRAKKFINNQESLFVYFSK